MTIHKSFLNAIKTIHKSILNAIKQFISEEADYFGTKAQ
jgi:hypothetical protein